MPHTIATPFGTFRLCRRCGVGSPEEEWTTRRCPECGGIDYSKKIREDRAIMLGRQVRNVRRRTGAIGIGVGYSPGRVPFLDAAGLAWQPKQIKELLRAVLASMDDVEKQYLTEWPPRGNHGDQ